MAEVVGWGLVFIMLAGAAFGAYFAWTNRIPGKQRQRLRWGDKEISVTNIGVLVMLVCLVLAVIVYFAVRGPADDSGADTNVVDATPQAPPTSVGTTLTAGPWIGQSNGVRMEVTRVNFGAGHRADIRFTMVNGATSTLAMTSQSFSVVDSTERAFSPDTSAGTTAPVDDETLDPGQTNPYRVILEYPFDRQSQSFDVRMNVSFDGSSQHFTIASPGIAIPAVERVG